MEFVQATPAAWGVTHIVGGDFDGAHFKRLLIDPNVYLAPDAAFGAAMLAGVPLAFDAGTVDQKVQRVVSPAIGQTHVQCFLAAAQGAEIGHTPIQAGQLQQALNKACHLPKRQAKQHLYRQVSLDGSVAELALSPALAAWRRGSRHLRIKPD